jgi:hypothetical protein
MGWLLSPIISHEIWPTVGESASRWEMGLPLLQSVHAASGGPARRRPSATRLFLQRTRSTQTDASIPDGERRLPGDRRAS